MSLAYSKHFALSEHLAGRRFRPNMSCLKKIRSEINIWAEKFLRFDQIDSSLRMNKV